MLKLLKYEWKACARTCLPLYGVLILMSLISRILYVIPKNASLVSKQLVALRSSASDNRLLRLYQNGSKSPENQGFPGFCYI